MKDLHSKFRSLVALTEFISAANKGGYPTLQFADDWQKRSSRRTLSNDVLHALADILVRDREVVAVGVSGPNIIAMEGETEEAMSELDSVDAELADAADREALGFPVGDSTIAEVIDLSCVGITNISAIVNPDMTDDKVHGFPESSHCMLIGPGQSYLPEKLPPIGKLYEYFVQNIKYDFHPAFEMSY
jgi:hypothetical protein